MDTPRLPRTIAALILTMGTAALILTMATAAAAATAAVPKRDDQILIQGLVAGSQTVETVGADSVRAEYSYNDRGRGDHIIATWKLDSAGVPIEYSGSGNDYMKAAVTETFSISGGKAKWHNRAEQGEKALTGENFYVPNNAPPEFTGVLARALLKAPGHTLPLLPGGEARITQVGPTGDLTQYQITGLDFSPTPIWLDHDGNTGATLSGWFSVIPTTRVASVEKLEAAQTAADDAWSARLARQLTPHPYRRPAHPQCPAIRSTRPVSHARNERVVRTGHVVRIVRIPRCKPPTERKSSTPAENS